ncbi:MAG: hypothetical protein EP350_09440 [Alphaproteobacteria bacterium]|nr:MAG: hypothetical protein EP350_09440 [Alphaproteobacteria bacterium]
MTPSLPLSGRVGVFALALIYTSLTFGAALTPAPAVAKDTGPYYVAELAAPAKEARTIAGGVAWNCEGTTCVAGKGNSRPLRVCRSIEREFGEVKNFVTNGEELAEDKLAACNA